MDATTGCEEFGSQREEIRLSCWAGLKRGYMGVYHWMSGKHLGRYVAEFVGRQNIRAQDTIDQMKALCKTLKGKGSGIASWLLDNFMSG